MNAAMRAGAPAAESATALERRVAAAICDRADDPLCRARPCAECLARAKRALAVVPQSEGFGPAPEPWGPDFRGRSAGRDGWRLGGPSGPVDF